MAAAAFASVLAADVAGVWLNTIRIHFYFLLYFLRLVARSRRWQLARLRARLHAITTAGAATYDHISLFLSGG